MAGHIKDRLNDGKFACTRTVDFDADLFETTMDTLSAAGYAQYEISNYARPGFESRHNLAYWRGSDYLGFGPSAFSTIGLERRQHLADTAEYTRRILAGESTVGFTEHLSPQTRAGERAAFGMRMSEGVPLAELRPWSAALAEFRELGFVEDRAGRAVLTRRGRLMADAVAEAFV